MIVISKQKTGLSNIVLINPIYLMLLFPYLISLSCHVFQRKLSVTDSVYRVLCYRRKQTHKDHVQHTATHCGHI